MCRTILLIMVWIWDRCCGVMYGTVMFTGRHSGMLRRFAMRSMSLFSMASFPYYIGLPAHNMPAFLAHLIQPAIKTTRWQGGGGGGWI